MGEDPTNSGLPQAQRFLGTLGLVLTRLWRTFLPSFGLLCEAWTAENRTANDRTTPREMDFWAFFGVP